MAALPGLVEVEGAATGGTLDLRVRSAGSGSVDIHLAPAEAEALAGFLTHLARAPSDEPIDARLLLRGSIQVRAPRTPPHE